MCLSLYLMCMSLIVFFLYIYMCISLVRGGVNFRFFPDFFFSQNHIFCYVLQFILRWTFIDFRDSQFFENIKYTFHSSFPIHCICVIFQISILPSECSGAHPPLWMLESSCPAHSLIIGYGPQKKNASMVPCWQHRTFSNAGARAKPKKTKKTKKTNSTPDSRGPGSQASRKPVSLRTQRPWGPLSSDSLIFLAPLAPLEPGVEFVFVFVLFLGCFCLFLYVCIVFWYFCHWRVKNLCSIQK